MEVKFLKLLLKVRFGHLIELVVLSVKHLHFLFPTFLATKNCMQLSTQIYGPLHYGNGQANAFRHALWNVLIAKKDVII